MPQQCFSLFPSDKIQDQTIDPLNCVMSFTNLYKNAENVTIFDNEALFRLCNKFQNIESPSYEDINKLIAQVISSMTCHLRFGDQHCSYFELCSKMTKGLHFNIPSFSPITTREDMYSKDNTNIESLLARSVLPECQMITLNEQNHCTEYQNNRLLL